MLGDLLIFLAWLLGLIVLPSVINWLKGKRWWATLGALTNWHWIPAIRLAKPDSWWARRYYDADKLRDAKLRFGAPGAEASSPVLPAVLADHDEDSIVYEDAITRRAWKKAQRQADRAS